MEVKPLTEETLVDVWNRKSRKVRRKADGGGRPSDGV